MESNTYTNLTLQRSEVDAWQPKGWWGGGIDGRVTLSLVSMVGAGLLVYGATRRRSDSSPLWMISGATLLGCAAAGLGSWRLRSVRSGETDVVGQESMDSFPASDAPSSNTSTATPRRLQSEGKASPSYNR